MKFDYIEIVSQNELDVLLNETVVFHDSILKEMQILNRGYVTEKSITVMNYRFDALIHFQSPWSPFSFQLLLIGVEKLLLNDPTEYLSSIGIYERNKSTDLSEITLKLDTGFYVTCSKLFYKIKSRDLGVRSFLGSQIPTETMYYSRKLGEHYRQCGNCAESWIEDSNIIIAVCPGCDSVTQLED